jgi:uncharacterized protein (UPF0332 family)
MSFKFRSCISSRGLRKVPAGTMNVGAELMEAGKDLESAKHSLAEDDCKWSTIKAYYSMFHAFRSLLFSEGYTEKSHDCLIAGIEELFVVKGLLPSHIITDIRSAKTAREAADYGLTSGRASAEGTIRDAGEIFRITSEYLSGQGIVPTSQS